jgi:hypothetical protein
MMWPPEKWAGFWDAVYDAAYYLEFQGFPVNRSTVARWLAEKRPEYGRHPETLRQILQEHASLGVEEKGALWFWADTPPVRRASKTHGTGQRYRNQAERDRINAAVWRALTGEDEIAPTMAGLSEVMEPPILPTRL